MRWLIIILLGGVFTISRSEETRDGGYQPYYISGIQLLPADPAQGDIQVVFNEFGGIRYDYKQAVIAIRCCNPTHMSHSWCNLDRDDENCKLYVQ